MNSVSQVLKNSCSAYTSGKVVWLELEVIEVKVRAALEMRASVRVVGTD